MLLQIGPLLRLGSKCYYGWDFYYAWVQMLLQMGPLLHLGPISPIITLVPSTAVRAVQISKVLLPLLQYATNRKPRLCRNVERN